MWQDIRWIVWNTLRTTFRKRSSLLLYLGLPIAGVLASLLLYGGGGQDALRVGIVNNDGGAQIAADTISYVGSLNHIQLQTLTEEELKKDLAAGKLDTGLVLQKGYSGSVIQGKPEGIVLQSVKGQTVTAYVNGMLNAYLDNLTALSKAAGGDAAAFNRLYDNYHSGSFKLSTESVQDASVDKAMSTQSIGFLVMFMMISAVNLSEIILKSRADRTYFRILSSPASARTFVLSNLIINLIIMIVQVVVTLFVLRNIFGIDPGIPVAGLGGMLILFALVSVGLSLVIVSFSKNSAAASAMSNLIIVPSCLLAGCFFPISIMPDAIRRIGDFMPQRWVLQSIDQLQNGDSSRIVLNMAVLAAFALVFFLIAAYRFGRTNDTRSFI